MKLISSYQKKILIIALAALLGFALFWLLVYLPSGKVTVKLKDEITLLDRSIKKVDELAKKIRSKETTPKLLLEKAEKIKRNLLTKEDVSIKMLSELAKSFNLENFTLTPGPKKQFLDEDGKKIILENKVLTVSPVSIKMKCFYRDLALYLDFLDKKVISYMIIQKLSIVREHPISLKLNATLDLDLYSLN